MFYLSNSHRPLLSLCILLSAFSILTVTVNAEGCKNVANPDHAMKPDECKVCGPPTYYPKWPCAWSPALCEGDCTPIPPEVNSTCKPVADPKQAVTTSECADCAPPTNSKVWPCNFYPALCKGECGTFISSLSASSENYPTDASGLPVYACTNVASPDHAMKPDECKVCGPPTYHTGWPCAWSPALCEGDCTPTPPEVNSTCKPVADPKQAVTTSHCAKCAPPTNSIEWPCTFSPALCQGECGTFISSLSGGSNSGSGSGSASGPSCSPVQCPRDVITNPALKAGLSRADPIPGDPVYSDIVSQNRPNVIRVINIFNYAKWNDQASAGKDANLDWMVCSSQKAITMGYNCSNDKSARWNFNGLFPHANFDLQGAGRMPQDKNEEDTTQNQYSVYSWGGFLKAISKYPALCGGGLKERALDETEKEALCKRELATMFSHFGQETGYNDQSKTVVRARQALYYFEERGCRANPSACPYRDSCNHPHFGVTYRCANMPVGAYYGRGAKQLSYAYNVGPFSEAVLGDRNILLQDPNIMVTAAGAKTAQGNQGQPWLAFASATFFYMTPKPPKPSIHDLMLGYYIPSTNSANEPSQLNEMGFGDTTNIINGGRECNKYTETPMSVNRIEYWNYWITFFGNENDRGTPVQQGCKTKKKYSGNGAGYFPYYWGRTETGGCGLSAIQSGWPSIPTIYSNYNWGLCMKTLNPNCEYGCLKTEGISAGQATECANLKDCAGLENTANKETSPSENTPTDASEQSQKGTESSNNNPTDASEQSQKGTESSLPSNNGTVEAKPSCTAMKMNDRGVTDKDCAQCAPPTNYPNWPCNSKTPILCEGECGALIGKPIIKEKAKLGKDECVAIFHGAGGVTNEKCGKCAPPQNYKWWPCDMKPAACTGSCGQAAHGNAPTTEDEAMKSQNADGSLAPILIPVVVVAALVVVAAVFFHQRRKVDLSSVHKYESEMGDLDKRLAI